MRIQWKYLVAPVCAYNTCFGVKITKIYSDYAFILNLKYFLISTFNFWKKKNPLPGMWISCFLTKEYRYILYYVPLNTEREQRFWWKSMIPSVSVSASMVLVWNTISLETEGGYLMRCTDISLKWGDWPWPFIAYHVIFSLAEFRFASESAWNHMGRTTHFDVPDSSHGPPLYWPSNFKVLKNVSFTRAQTWDPWNINLMLYRLSYLATTVTFVLKS